VVRRDVVAAKCARLAQRCRGGAHGAARYVCRGYAMLDYERVHTEAQTGIPALRTFLVAIAEAAGADPAGPQ